jgi:surface protein
MQKIFAKKATLLVLVLILALSVSAQNLFLEETTFSVGEDISIFSSTSGTLKAMEIHGESQLSFDTLENQTTTFSFNKPGEYVATLTQNESVTDFLTFSIVDLQANEILTINKHTAMPGETVIIAVHSLELTNYRLFYEYQGRSQKYSGDLSLITFSTPKPGTHTFILKDLQDTEIARESIEITPSDVQPEIAEPATVSEPQNETETQPKTHPQLLGQIPRGLSFKGSINITDSKKKNVDYKIQSRMDRGSYDVAIEFTNSSIKKIAFEDVAVQTIEFGVDEIPTEKTSIDDVRSYAINPAEVNFTTAKVTAVASPNARELYKCKDYNFTTQTCHGNWVKIADIIPGEEYSFLLTPEDPAFAEVGVTSINTRKSTYRPGETAEIIAVALDNQGYLIENANVTIQVIDPNGTTHNIESYKTSKGIYEANYTVATEGLHLIKVEAIGTGVNNSMQSHFMSSTNHSFDIIRAYPATIDPWQGPYTASLQVISYVPDASFTLTESLPPNFTVETTGSAQIVYTQNATLLIWTITNNSIVNYSANAPLITPDLYSLGPAKITYSSGEFQEARPWYLAIDPLINSTNQQSGTIQYTAQNYTTTVVDEVFEGTLTNWTNGTGWQTQTGIVFSGSRSMGKIAGSAVGNLTMKSVATNSSRKVLVQFAMYDNNLDAAGDLLLFFNDSGGNWDQIVDLGTFSAIEEAWVPYSINITDSQYFHSGFALMFVNSVALTTGGGGENFYLDDVIIRSETEDINANKSFTTYTDIISDAASPYVNNITVTIQVSSYDNSGSTGRSNTNSDILLEMYNGSQYVQIGGFGITGTGNYTKTITSQGVNQSILSAWSALNNRDMRVFGSYLDANTTQLDQISYTGLWATLDYNFSGLALGNPNISRNNPLNGTYISVSINITAINNTLNTARAIVNYPNGTNYQNYSLGQQDSTTIYYNDTILVPSYPFGNYTISIWANDSTAVNYTSNTPAQFAPVWAFNQSAVITTNGNISEWNLSYFVVDSNTDTPSIGNESWYHNKGNVNGTSATSNTPPSDITVIYASSQSQNIGGSSPPLVYGEYVFFINDAQLHQHLSSNVSVLHHNVSFNGNYLTGGDQYIFSGDSVRFLYRYNVSNISELLQLQMHDAEPSEIKPLFVPDDLLYLRNLNLVTQSNATTLSGISTAIIEEGSDGISGVGDYVYIADSTNSLFLQLNASNISRTIATYPISFLSFIDTPAIAGGYVYILDTNNQKLLQLNASNVSNKISEFTMPDISTAGPAIGGGYVYVADFNGYLFQLNASNVSQQIANYTFPDTLQNSPTLAGGHLYIPSDDGQVYELNASNISQKIANISLNSTPRSSVIIANGFAYIMTADYLVQLGEGIVSSQGILNIANTSLAHNSTNLYALISTTSSIDTSASYRIYLSNNSRGNNTSPDGSVLPFNYTALIQINNSACHIYSWTGSILGSCSYANNSHAIEVSASLSSVGLSQGNYTNVTFETAKSATRYDMAPDMSSFVQYYISPLSSTPVTVNINTSQNNTFTSDNTPTIAFNVTASGASSCTLYFGSVGYNYTTGINADTNTLITANASVPDGSYLVSINCTDSSTSDGSDYLNFTIDTTSPSITNVLNWSLTNTSIKINWTTDETANGSISYGPTAELLEGTASHTDYLTTHNLNLTGLTVATNYYFIIRSCDSLNNCDVTGFYNFATQSLTSVNINTSGNNTFTTDNTPSIDFNFIADSTASCTLYFNGVGYNYTTGLSQNTQILMTANASLPGGSYLVNINCTDGVNSAASSYLNYTINSAPVMNYTRTTPNASILGVQNLMGYCSATDINNDIMTYNYTWFKTNSTNQNVAVKSGISIIENTIGTSSQHSCSIRATDGRVMCWGTNTNAQLGNGSTGGNSSIPILTADSSAYTSISLGSFHACGIRANDSRALCWGRNLGGTLGTGNTTLYNFPVLVNTTDQFKQIVSGQLHTCAVRANDSYVFCWGTNTNGQLGIGNTTTIRNPISIANNTAYKTISTVSSTVCGIRANDSRVLCWGENTYGQLGIGNFTTYTYPVPINDTNAYKAISMGSYHACGIRANDSRVLCWGRNNYGQLGNGSNGTINANSSTPILVADSSAYTMVSAGETQTCGIRANDSRVLCWGTNNGGELGIGNDTAYFVPTLINDTAAYSTISAGFFYTCGVRTNDSRVLCWGLNSNGRFGNGYFDISSNNSMLTNQTSANLVPSYSGKDAFVSLLNSQFTSIGDNYTLQCCPSDGSATGSCLTGSITSVYDPIAITNVLNWSINRTNAAINWTTSVNANGTVTYGTTLSLSTGSQAHSNLLTTHNVNISGLTHNTLYYYNITSCDGFGNCNTSGPYNFTTEDYAGPAFSASWNTSRTSIGSSNASTVSLPIYNGGTYDFYVDWGDGTTSMVTSYNDPDRNHTYAANGTYTINITGTLIGFKFNNAGDRQKIGNVNRWGILNLGNGGNYFTGSSNINSTATDALNLTGTTNLSNAFNGATRFNGNISNWNVSQVTNMASMFVSATSFNQNIGSWDTSQVVNMTLMFFGASSFNQPIGNWNTSQVKDMSFMFRGASSFNQSLNGWNTGQVTNMTFMFYGASNFNGNITNWDTSNVRNMDVMFYGATRFNQPIGGWNTSQVRDMNYMFYTASSFNQNISAWNTNQVTNMTFMFGGATSFNGNVSDWNTSQVKSTYGMFFNAANFNQNLLAWDTSNVVIAAGMFFGATSFNQNISAWNTSQMIDLGFMFSGATSFNQNIGSWDIHNVSYMEDMFSDVTLSTENYDAILIGWAAQTPKSSVNFSAGNSQYSTCGGGAAAKTILNTTYDWNITDGGENASYCSGTASPSINSLDFTSSINPAAGQNRTVYINFTASDADGNLNTSSASLKINTSTSTKNSVCQASTINSTTVGFNCSVEMQHFDVAGLWYINVTIADNSTSFATNFTEYFTYNQLLYLQATPSIFSMGSYEPNGSYQSPSSNITLDNMGNVNLTRINITAYDLANGSNIIGAGNFTANYTNAVGVALANNSPQQIPGARLNIDQQGAESNLTIFFFFRIPNVPDLDYASLFEWVVTADE